MVFTTAIWLPIIQEYLLKTAIVSFMVLLALLIVIFFIYTVVLSRHFARDDEEKAKADPHRKALLELLSAEGPIGEASLSRYDKPALKGVIRKNLDRLTDGVAGPRLGELYKALGCLEEDMELLRKGAWWHQVSALHRLEILQASEAEDRAFPLLRAKNLEVHLAALRMLAAIRSPKLGEAVYDLFLENSRWLYRYFVNILSDVDLPREQIAKLGDSSDRRLRMAAATLLRCHGREEDLPLLSRLAGDAHRDVRRESLLSLARLPLPAWRDVLDAHLGDENPQVRIAVTQALTAPIVMADEAVPTLLERLADDEDFSVRYHAFHSLRKLGETGRPVIERLRERHPEMAAEFLEEVRI